MQKKNENQKEIKLEVTVMWKCIEIVLCVVFVKRRNKVNTYLQALE